MEELREPALWGPKRPCPSLPTRTEVSVSFYLVKVSGAGLLGRSWSPVCTQGPPPAPSSLTARLTPAGEVLLEDAASSAGAVDVALVREQTQVLAALVVEAAWGEFTWGREGGRG